MKPRVLVGCEYSGTVREQFAALGWDAWSCDLMPSERPGQHIERDVLSVLKDPYYGDDENWSLFLGFPPCTDLCVSGARWFPEKKANGTQRKSIDFFLSLACCGVKHLAIENPIGIMSTHFRKPDQIVQPWQFGHGEVKATCLWLKNLPKLNPSDIVDGRTARVHRMPPGPDRWKERSRTFAGIAKAMADQWTRHIFPDGVPT